MRSTLRRWDDCNEVAARIILSDPGRYAGLPVAWAEPWVARGQDPCDQRHVGSSTIVSTNFHPARRRSPEKEEETCPYS
jgi:hypothetical protein